MRLYLLYCSCLVMNLACLAQQADSLTRNKNRVYNNSIIGWKMEVPDNWKIISGDAFINYVNRKDASINMAKINPMLVFQKDSNNYFISTFQLYGDTVKSKWEYFMEQRDSTLLMRYYQRAKKEHLDVTFSSRTRMLSINERWFIIYELNKYGPDSLVTGSTILYSRLVNDSTFTAAIHSNNDSNKNVMMKAFEQSSFSR